MESAVSLLRRAAELDSGEKYSEALVCYQEGIQPLIGVVKSPFGRVHLLPHAHPPISAISAAGPHHERISIAENAQGFGYEHVFLESTIPRIEFYTKQKQMKQTTKRLSLISKRENFSLTQSRPSTDQATVAEVGILFSPHFPFPRMIL